MSDDREHHALFLAICLRKAGKAGECCSAREHGVTEDHEETANYGEIAEEEVEVENKTITDGLHDDDGKETADSVFCISLGDNCS